MASSASGTATADLDNQEGTPTTRTTSSHSFWNANGRGDYDMMQLYLSIRPVMLHPFQLETTLASSSSGATTTTTTTAYEAQRTRLLQILEEVQKILSDDVECNQDRSDQAQQ
jgi:hypothetical protein